MNWGFRLAYSWSQDTPRARMNLTSCVFSQVVSAIIHLVTVQQYVQCAAPFNVRRHGNTEITRRMILGRVRVAAIKLDDICMYTKRKLKYSVHLPTPALSTRVLPLRLQTLLVLLSTHPPQRSVSAACRRVGETTTGPGCSTIRGTLGQCISSR